MSLGPLYVFLVEVSVQELCPFFNWVVCLPGVDSCEFFIYFGDQALVWGIIGKYVLPNCWFSFHFNAVFFSHAESFYFDEVPFVYSFLYVPCSREHKYWWKYCCVAYEIFLPLGLFRFSSRTSMVSQLICKSFIHLEFIFVYVVYWWSNFIFLHEAFQISQSHLLKKLFLLYFMLLPPLSNINWPYRLEFISGLSVLFHWSMCLFLCQFQDVLSTVSL